MALDHWSDGVSCRSARMEGLQRSGHDSGDSCSTMSEPPCDAAAASLSRSRRHQNFWAMFSTLQVREDVCRELDILTEALSNKYMGLPTMVGVDRTDCFQHLIDRVCQRLKGWKEKVLSMQGKEILLKSVAQAIPSYSMSVFKLHKGICKSITDEMPSFSWGDREAKKTMHWYAWWKMCIQRRKGAWVLETCTTLILLC